MAKKNDTTNLTELLLRCMGEADPMLSMLEWLCAQLMEAEVSNKLGAGKNEHCDDRTNSRSGYRPRRYDTWMDTMDAHCKKLVALRMYYLGGYTHYFSDLLAKLFSKPLSDILFFPCPGCIVIQHKLTCRIFPSLLRTPPNCAILLPDYAPLLTARLCRGVRRGVRAGRRKGWIKQGGYFKWQLSQ